MKNFSRHALAALSFSLAFCWAVAALGEDFYKGKTIRLIVATTSGGGFDAYSRMLTRHMGKHIPGNPMFLVENMPGAAFMIGTNYLYKQAKPTGSPLSIGSALSCYIKF